MSVDKTKIRPKTPKDNSESGVEKKTDSSSNVSKTKSLTFKDWKILKESKNNSVDNNSKKNSRAKDYSDNNNSRNNRFGNNNVGSNRASNFPGPQNFFGRTNFGNNFNNNMPQFNIPPMGFNNNFNNNRNFNNNNNFNNVNQSYNNDMFDGCNNNFSNGFYKNYNNNLNRQNNPNNLELPDSFFASDGIFRQKDMLQTSLQDNPFRNEKKATELLNKLQNLEFTKPIKKKRQDDKPKGDMKKQLRPSQEQNKVLTKPRIFVPNPKVANGDQQPPFIPKPSLPQDIADLPLEEKKQQWKEYREAMKPFKNRNFYNARRVVQRLGKKDPKDLDEKEIFRLANSREIMATHKQRLSAKYANYIKDNEYCEELGELYVLQRKPQKDWDDRREPMPNRHTNYGNFGNNSNYNNNGFRVGQKDGDHFNHNFGNEAGRKIVGGYMGYRNFVSGGIMRGSEQNS